MAIRTDLELKRFFETGDVPTQQQFFDLIDSKLNVGSPSVGMSIGGSVSGGTTGSLLYVGAAAALAQDNSNLYYDFLNKRIGLGTVTPNSRIHMKGDTNADATPLQTRYERPAGVFNSNTNWISQIATQGAIDVGFFSLAQQAIGQGTRWSFATTNSTAVNATESMRLSQEKRLSIGGTILNGATVDVFSESNLSSFKDIRVRNNANSADKFQVLGDNSLIGSGSVSWDAKQTHTTGATITISGNVRTLLVNPAVSLAGLVITLPATGGIKDGQEILIVYGGTIGTGNVVTGNSVIANAGQTLLTTVALATAKAGDVLTYKWIASTNCWYNINK